MLPGSCSKSGLNMVNVRIKIMEQNILHSGMQDMITIKTS